MQSKFHFIDFFFAHSIFYCSIIFQYLNNFQSNLSEEHWHFLSKQTFIPQGEIPNRWSSHMMSNSPGNKYITPLQSILFSPEIHSKYGDLLEFVGEEYSIGARTFLRSAGIQMHLFF
jgi:hypothetical protein